MSKFHAGQPVYHTTLRQWAVLVRQPIDNPRVWLVNREGAAPDPVRGYTNQWAEVYLELDKRTQAKPSPGQVAMTAALAAQGLPAKANPTALDTQIGGGHYKSRGIQPVTYCHANGIGFMEGCVIKYVTRYKDKGGMEDLLKAKHFLDLIIAHEYPTTATTN